ncbi:QUALITY PROTEIN: unc-79 homolog [Octopus vulgaris]|uniref:QUALITY PROTEIN: unc-79 homolog n=1 Tax=Octopus vulgaris TaxID=6645 RepID=A0AA36BGF1_OCTVU|nr:QUALITY PROTEIN: unc-79 homolog [Octopus vulgaris]
MATRAATFTSKIQTLQEYQNRIRNDMLPEQSGVDIVNTLKYFSQTLLSVLKDVPDIPSDSYGPRQRDSVRLSVFPNLNYSGLYEAVLNIIDIVPQLLVKQHDLGEAISNVLGCLVPFLEHELLNALPYTVASTLAIFPPSLHKDTIDLLCSSLLPMTLGTFGHDEPTYASESAAAIITIVFQHTENSMFHSQILEFFMSMKREVVKDLLSVIAYGPPSARAPAANLLFYYWPQLNPSHSERRGIHYKYQPWPRVLCQRENCVNSGKCQAVKMCPNPALAIQSRDKPPPLYVCSDCAEPLQRVHDEYMVDILLPMSHVPTTCENKNCRSSNAIAVCTCFNINCASQNGNRPIRYCQNCHMVRHSSETGQRHIFHESIPEIWHCDREMQRYLIDAIVSLLKEAQPLQSKRVVEMGEEHFYQVPEEDDFYDEGGTDRKLLSRYGIWLLVELCKPKEDISIEILGRLLSMLFQWFDATAYLTDDNAGSALERLKPEYISKWLQKVAKSHFEVIVSCLLPHPVEYARVGGYWDTITTRTTQIKEGLNCFFCLVPYDIITFEIWDYVMPYWLEAIRTEVPLDELNELKVLLNKAFDIDMCPLPFTLERMYHFVSERFHDGSAYVQEQSLQWLQVLSSLDIIIPIHLLLKMFKNGVEFLHRSDPSKASSGRDLASQSLLSPASPVEEYLPQFSPERSKTMNETVDLFERETELHLPCFLMMLDILLKQLELQETPRNLGIYNETSQQLMHLLSTTLDGPWDGTHTCSEEHQSINCLYCQNIAMWYQMSSKILHYICPRDVAKIPAKELPKLDNLSSVSTAHSKASDSSSSSGQEKMAPHLQESPKYDFFIAGMPIYLQLYNSLLQGLCSDPDVDVCFYLLTSLKYLVLHGETLNYSVQTHQDFVKYSLSKKLMPVLWKMMQAEHSQLASICVPFLLHTLTLPTGADILWHMVENDFGSDDWKVRFAAVEKVVVICRLLDVDSIHNNQVVQTALSHAFCYLVGSLEDMNTAVSQRTIIYLETIKPSAIKCLIQCLEFQFDTVISDRTMILHRMYLLSSILPDQPILTWNFFLSRFDTLSLEAQLDLENTGNISYPTDLTSSDRESEHFLRKLNRARFALARTDSIRSVSESLKNKPPYRRAVSVPLHLVTRTAPPKDKEKSCIRQQSAPQFSLGRRMTAKFGLGTFTNYVFAGGGNLREFTDEESNFTELLQKAMDLEGVDRDTIHQLVALLMKFMAKIEDEDIAGYCCPGKPQSIVLRHLNVLLGYNQTEQTFSVPPYKLRSSAVFNAFISGVPYILDRNFALGNMILPITLMVLKYSPSPQRYASDYQPPNYTLWFLEPCVRHSWLMAFLVVLYKYQVNANSATTEIVQILIRIVINTIEAQHHKCKKGEEGFTPPIPQFHRSRDASKVSASDLENIQETETPPQSPTYQKEESGGGYKVSNLHIKMTSPVKDSIVHYTKNKHTVKKVIPEGPMSDTDSTPTHSSSNKKDQKKAAKHNRFSRQGGRHGAANEVDVRSSTSPAQSPDDNDDFKHSIVPLRDVTDDATAGTTTTTSTATSASSSSTAATANTAAGSGEATSSPTTAVEKKMAQQIQEFEQQNEVQKHPAAAPTLSSSTTTDGNSGRDGTTTSEWSRDQALSEVDSTEDSEKGQTSDAESEKHHTATDSGDAALDENKEDSQGTLFSRDFLFKPNYRQRKARKTGLTTVELQKIFPELSENAPSQAVEGSGRTSQRTRRSELLNKSQQKKTHQRPQFNRYGDTVMVDRCPECHVILEQYDEETIGLCILVLSAFIYREPSLAMPTMLDSLQCVAKIASSNSYPWQVDSTLMAPGNCVSIARQFMRCCLHHLAPNGIFPVLFQSNLEDTNFWKTMASALIDFNELTCHTPMQLLLEGLNNKKTLPSENIMLLLSNLATYLNCIPLETSSPLWPNILTQFEIFFRHLPLVLPNPCDTTSILRIMISILKIPGITNVRGILEPFSKVMSFTIQNCSFKLQQIIDICSLCSRTMGKERDKLFLTRTVILELVQALKFKQSLPDENLLSLVQFVVLDAGGTICPSNIVNNDVCMLFKSQSQMLTSTCVADCMKQYLNDCVEFISDLHTLTKVKSTMKGGALNEDTLGSQLKSGIAQYIALEITKSNGRENKAIARYLPWLYHPPSAMQQGPKEFIDCVSHIRLLSWILIGSLTHTAVTEGSESMYCLPVPLDAGSHIAEHIMVILTGFADYSKTSVLHMSSLFHAFILCQLWTMYCESAAAHHPANSEQHQTASDNVMDFWARVTPGVLQLLSHSKVLAERVNLHFLRLMEALQECNSSVLAKLFPMWTAILYAYHAQLPAHLQVRLQACQNWEPPLQTKEQTSASVSILMNWLKRIQFKLGQTEVQSAAATQFYTV